MPTYRKTALVYAEQFLPNAGQIPEQAKKLNTVLERPDGTFTHYIETLEGNHYLREGDYICTGSVAGEYWNVEQSIFEATYEEVK